MNITFSAKITTAEDTILDATYCICLFGCNWWVLIVKEGLEGLSHFTEGDFRLLPLVSLFLGARGHLVWGQNWKRGFDHLLSLHLNEPSWGRGLWCQPTVHQMSSNYNHNVPTYLILEALKRNEMQFRQHSYAKRHFVTCRMGRKHDKENWTSSWALG